MIFRALLIVIFSSFILLAQSDKETTKFDPARDPYKDLKETITIAKKTNKRIILDVGGEWCIWCKRIDAFMHEDKDITASLDKNFIIMKVNFSKENKNEKFLSQYPKVDGYPHFFVLEKDGKLLHSQNTAEFEENKTYGKDKFIAFLNKWAPASKK